MMDVASGAWAHRSLAGRPLQEQYPFCVLDLKVMAAAGLQDASGLGKAHSAPSELPSLDRMLSRTISVNGLRRTIDLEALADAESDLSEGLAEGDDGDGEASGSPDADALITISDSVTNDSLSSAFAQAAVEAKSQEEPLALQLKAMALEQPPAAMLNQRRLLRHLSTMRPMDRSKFVLDTYGHQDETAREALLAYKELHKRHKELLREHLWDMADEVQAAQNLVPVKIKDKELLARALQKQLQQADKVYFQAAAWLDIHPAELAKVGGRSWWGLRGLHAPRLAHLLCLVWRSGWVGLLHCTVLAVCTYVARPGAFDEARANSMHCIAVLSEHSHKCRLHQAAVHSPGCQACVTAGLMASAAPPDCRATCTATPRRCPPCCRATGGG